MDFGLSQADMESIQGGLDPSGATGGVAPSQQDQDNYAQATANIIAEPKVGSNRTNITNVGSGSNLRYDPAFAAAFDISRGLDPTNNMGGTGGLAVPSYLRPQVQGDLVLNEAGDRMMYGSGLEKFVQETGPEIVRGFQNMGIGALINRIGSTISDAFTDAKSALGFDGGAQGGLKAEDLQPAMGTLDPSDRFLGNMSQQGADIRVTDPVVRAAPPVTMAAAPQISPLFDQFGNPYRTRADRLAAEVAQQSQSGGIASVAPNMAREANISVDDAVNPTSSFTNFNAKEYLDDFEKSLRQRQIENNKRNRDRLLSGNKMADASTFNILVPGFKSSPMSKQDADKVKENLEKNNSVYQQMSDASTFNILQGLGTKFNPQINEILRQKVSPNLRLDTTPKRDIDDPNKVMPYLGLEYRFKTA